MIYDKTVKARFIKRHNRFVGEAVLEGKTVFCHVRNTGRCKELLVPGATVYLEDLWDKPGNRKYQYGLVAVIKENGHSGKGILINMDSGAPNKVVFETLKAGEMELNGFPNGLEKVRGESVYGNSRLDFHVMGKDDRGMDREGFIEVKGVTLEEEGIAMFPDAPTERGVKHVEELIKAKEEGFESFLIFLVQMEGIIEFRPNSKTHPAFAKILKAAEAKGVEVLAYNAHVTAEGISLGKKIKVHIEP